MEPIPIKLLNREDYCCLSTDEYKSNSVNSNGLTDCDSSKELESLTLQFLTLSSVIMDNLMSFEYKLTSNSELSNCISSNRSKLRSYVVVFLMKWLKDDILIRSYRNMKEKGNIMEGCNFPISLSTFIVRSVLTSSIEVDEYYKVILDCKDSKSCETFIMENILNDYISKYKDLRYFFLKNILNLLNILEDKNNQFMRSQEKEKIKAIDNRAELSIISVILLRVYHILINLRVPTKYEKVETSTSVEKVELFFGSELSKISADKINKFEKDYRLTYQKLWIALIKIIVANSGKENKIIPLAFLRNVLEYVSEFVIPIISNPLELADIYKSCFDGIDNERDSMDKLAISVISLNGIFYLIVNSRLNEHSSADGSEENISSGYYRQSHFLLRQITRFG
ncbi:CCAAT-binding factor (CBF)/MAK21 family protein [Cryptosporidium felis]|nr:CCAAT-binding factor (CBF)/MAK21 family protein [Cryptosporidium felis]